MTSSGPETKELKGCEEEVEEDENDIEGNEYDSQRHGTR